MGDPKVDISPLTATFPWRSISYPFPVLSSVDRIFEGLLEHNHASIVSAPDVFYYLLDLFDSGWG